MKFNDDETIQWGGREVEQVTLPEGEDGDLMNYINPPTRLTLRGKKYIYTHQSRIYSGARDGERWHCVRNVDSQANEHSFWVCEQREGEFDEVFFPRGIAMPDYVIR